MSREVIEVEDLEFRKNMQTFVQVTEKGLSEVVENQARGYTRRVVGMTPPMGGGRKGIAAKRAQEGRILSDMHGIFAPVKLQKKEPEKHPELMSLLMGQQMRRRKTAMRRRQRTPKYYVDERKFKRLYMEMKRRVGWLAGGWNAAGEALNIKRPAWVRRHGSGKGSASVRLGDHPLIVLTNDVGYGDQAHLGRISDAALNYQRKALARQLPFLMRKYLRGARLAG